MSKSVLIFGGAGFVGRYLAEEFDSHGYRVYGTDLIEHSHKYFHAYTCMDMMNFPDVLKLIDYTKPGYIINLAVVSSVADSWNVPQKAVTVNINGTLNILEAVRMLKLKTRILLIGSSEEYAVSDKQISEDYQLNGNNPYGITKMAQEHFAQLYRSSYGMDIISTRTFNHTGIGQPDKFVLPAFVKQVASIHKTGKEGKMYVGNLSARRDFGDVRDMVSAYRMILESQTSRTIFNVGSGKCYCLEDLLMYIISLASAKIEVVVSSEKLRPVDNPIIWCDNSLLRRETGWTPRYTVYDAVRGMFLSMTE